MSNNTILATAPLATTGFHIKATGTTLGNSLIWDNGTNVGIGNTNTTYKLEVTGSTATSQLWQLADNSTEMKIGRYNSSFPNAYIDAIGPSGDVGFQFRTQVGGAGGGTKMTITSAGSVLIGTSTAPSAIGVNDLLVLGKSGSASNAINFSNGSTTNWAYILAESAKMVLGTGSSSSIAFETNGGSERMRITSAGNVGIGTSSPLQKLHVYNSASSSAAIFQGSSNSYIQLGVSSESYIGNVSGAMLFEAGGSERMRITSGGVVQISALTSNGTVSTQSSNGSLYVSSDANLKIEDGFVENGLEKVLALKPRYFYWKDKEAFSADRQLGFYAQEVNAVSEETANTPPEGCGWGIYDRGLVALLTAAIQEQNQIIQELNERLNKAGL